MANRKRCRLAALCVALALLAGCGGAAGTGVSAGDGEANSGAAVPLSTQSGASFSDLAADFYEFSDCRFSDFCRTGDGYTALTGKKTLLLLDSSLSVVSQEEYTGFTEGTATLLSYRESDGAVYTLEAAQDAGKCVAAKDGTVLFETEGAYDGELALSGDGSLYVRADGTLYCDGAKLSLPGNTSDGSFYEAACLLEQDGTVSVILKKMTPGSDAAACSASYLCPLSGKDAVQLGTELPLTAITAACKDKETVYLLDGDKVYSVAEGQMAVYADLLSLGVAGSDAVRLLSHDGRLLLVQRSGVTVLRARTAEDASEAAPITLRLAVAEYQADAISDAVARYNRLNTGYQITIERFSNTDAMGLALASGECFDLIDEGSVGILESYARKGFLAPLDEIPALQSEDVFQNVLNTFRLDGTLYYISPTFQCDSFCFPSTLLQDGTLTVDGLSAISEELSFYSHQYKDSILNMMMDGGIDQWLVEDGFLDNSFLEMLRYCNQYADVNAVEPAPMVEGAPQQELIAYYVKFDLIEEKERDSSGFRSTAERYQELFGAEAVVTPNLFSSYSGLAVRAADGILIGMGQGANQDGASSFLEYLISDAYYTGSPTKLWGLPLRRSICAVAEDDAMGQEMLDLIEHADHSGMVSEFLSQIIAEEAATYFNGDCTVEECAQRIQSRVDIYLSEQG